MATNKLLYRFGMAGILTQLCWNWQQLGKYVRVNYYCIYVELLSFEIHPFAYHCTMVCGTYSGRFTLT